MNKGVTPSHLPVDPPHDNSRLQLITSLIIITPCHTHIHRHHLLITVSIEKLQITIMTHENRKHLVTKHLKTRFQAILLFFLPVTCKGSQAFQDWACHHNPAQRLLGSIQPHRYSHEPPLPPVSQDRRVSVPVEELPYHHRESLRALCWGNSRGRVVLL